MKKKNNSDLKFKFNESKGEVELDNNATLKTYSRKYNTHSNSIQKNKKSFSFLPWIIAIVIIIVVFDKIENSNLNSTAQTVLNTEMHLPLTSIMSITFDNLNANCPLTLTANDKNYYIKLCDTKRENKTIAKFFIRAKEELTIKIPEGSYKIKYASGDKWYGEQKLFNNDGAYGESNVLNFHSDRYASNGHKISFYNTINSKTNDITLSYILRD